MDIIVDGRIFELQSAGGISRLFRELLPRMCELDMSLKIHLLSARIMPVLLPQHPRIEPVPLTYWESALRPGRYFKEARWRGRKRAAARWLDRNRADVWHATYYTLPGYQSCPSVVSVYDMIYEQLPQVYSTREHVWTKSQKEQSIMSADALICISRTTRAELISYYAVDPARVRVIPLAASPVFREMDSINASQQSEQPYLLYIGSRTGYENAATLFAAYARWSLRFDIGLVVVGKPLTAEESRQLQEMGVLNRVRVETDVSDERLAALYNQAVALVYPSLTEGFGLPLIEAMACGCPIVASRISASLEVAGEAAYYFEPENVDDLLHALDTAVRAGRAPESVQRGKKRAAAFSWENAARQTLELYYEIA